MKMKRVSLIILLAVLGVLLSGCCGERVSVRDGEFSIIAVPDTQFYSEKYHEVFYEQTEWIKNNAANLNCAFVIHEGDIVDNPGVEAEWVVADKAMSVLDGQVPYCFAVGNHDVPTELYNKYFPYSRYDEMGWYGGHYSQANDNSYHFFSAGGCDFMILCLRYDPDEEMLAWANSIVENHPDRRVIVATHSYLDRDKFTAEGKKVFEGLIKKHENIFLVLCGHLSVGRRVDTGDHGNTINSMLADYQGLEDGGQGWLRILTFSPATDSIKVRTYSTQLGKFFEEGDGKYSNEQMNNFTLEYDMSSGN